MTGAGREERLRMIFGITKAGVWFARDNETKIGMRMGYKSGAGSKLAGIWKNVRFEGHIVHRRRLENRRMIGYEA